MFQVITSVKQLNFGQLCNVYADELIRAGKLNYPNLNPNMQLLEAEQDFYYFLKSFLRKMNEDCFVWQGDGLYQSALRIEPYKDGVILTGLQTAPESRRNGYAKALLENTLAYLSHAGITQVYSHIRNDNIPSRYLHLTAGFLKISDYAAYIDGSVDQRSATYLKHI